MTRSSPPESVADLQRLDSLTTRTADPSGAPAENRDRITVRDPATDAVVGSVPACTPEDVSTAVDRAREAQQSWAERPVSERAAVLSRYHDRVLAHRQELLDLMQLESGKARQDAFEELLDVATNARYYASEGPGMLSSERRRGAFPLLTKTVEHRHPVGVVGVVSPWNYPLTLAVSDALPALLAGNAVVLKPDEHTPFTALRAVELLREAGLPDDLFQVVTGRGPELGEPLISSVDFLQFTGSSEVGRIVASQAGEHLIDCSLELGGKNPMLVLSDADVSKAAAGAVRGSFTTAGQLCISFERIYVHESVFDDFCDEFVERTRRLELGAAYDYGPDVGSMLSAEQVDKTERHVEDALSEGATVLTGGRRRPDLGPHFFEPTVLTDVPESATLSDEETFGPVAAVYPVSSTDEAVARANDSDYGLNAAVWTEDTAVGESVARRVDCGTVNVNEAFAATWASVDAPMGGMDDSGLGRRHGEHGLTKFTESQTVSTQRVVPFATPRRVPGWVWERFMIGNLRGLKRVAGLRSRVRAVAEKLPGGRR
ncbi:succinic semialdehyde dehydrogenase [Salinirubrum litoreum]|uniref:Succinic semialdehyde dehydrogenase n=1 Tax=Salinirubrum litoreum TaxID=1126234 RepID=A0ABD5R888_9EURY